MSFLLTGDTGYSELKATKKLKKILFWDIVFHDWSQGYMKSRSRLPEYSSLIPFPTASTHWFCKCSGLCVETKRHSGKLPGTLPVSQVRDQSTSAGPGSPREHRPRDLICTHFGCMCSFTASLSPRMKLLASMNYLTSLSAYFLLRSKRKGH